MNLQAINTHAFLLLFCESVDQHTIQDGQCNLALLEAAFSYPLQVAVGGEADVAALAAGYVTGVLRYGPFNKNNALAAFVAMGLFLSLNGWLLEASPEEAARVMLQYEANEVDETTLANWIRTHL